MEEPTPVFLQKTYSLADIMASVSSILKKTYENKSFWVRCELVKLNLHLSSGHCYVELADRNESTMVAQCKGIIWADQYVLIQKKFRSIVQSELNSGMKVLFQCSISFHPVHGFSLYIVDVEPAFTLGEMAKMKNDSIQRLKKEGVFESNKKLKLPLLPKRIAVISVETSRGYQDFISTIQHYPKSYALELSLFEATLQGDNAIPTINRALAKIKSRLNDFDVVTIIRGGAGDTGLACYDEYLLAKEVAAFPLPVVTGIGHATNETVTEMVAFKNCITPTAAADFFLEKFSSLDRLLDQTTDKLIQVTEACSQQNKEDFEELLSDFHQACDATLEKNKERILQQKDLLDRFGKRSLQDNFLLLENKANAIRTIPGRQLFAGHRNNLRFFESQLFQFFKITVEQKKNRLDNQSQTLKNITYQINNNQNELNLLSEKVKLLDPVNTLMRGYSITRKNGQAITSDAEIVNGDVLETTLANGILISTVNKKQA